MRVPSTDRRHAGAVRRLLADEIDAGRITALAATIHIEDTDPLAFWDECLDRVFPPWRTVPKTAYRQNVSDQLLLVAVRERLCKALSVDPSARATPERAKSPETRSRPLRTVRLVDLISIPLADLEVMREEEDLAYERELAAQGPVPLFAGAASTEMHVRKAALTAEHFTDPVRCGKCGEWMEKRTHSAHAHSRHNKSFSEIDWYSPKGF